VRACDIPQAPEQSFPVQDPANGRLYLRGCNEGGPHHRRALFWCLRAPFHEDALAIRKCICSNEELVKGGVPFFIPIWSQRDVQPYQGPKAPGFTPLIHQSEVSNFKVITGWDGHGQTGPNPVGEPCKLGTMRCEDRTPRISSPVRVREGIPRLFGIQIKKGDDR
jgi:hypothetical protein